MPALILRLLLLAGSAWGISAMSGDTTNIEHQQVYTESSTMEKVKMWMTLIISFLLVGGLIYLIILLAKKKR